jgi:hypothetical protein
MSPSEAVAYGLIDKVIEKRPIRAVWARLYEPNCMILTAWANSCSEFSYSDYQHANKSLFLNTFIGMLVDVHVGWLVGLIYLFSISWKAPLEGWVKSVMQKAPLDS